MSSIDHCNAFQRNIQFSSLIKAGERVREFNFRKPTRSNNATFYVDVADEKGERYQFSLIRDGDRWLLQGIKLPSWITSIEKQLDEAVRQHGDLSLP